MAKRRIHVNVENEATRQQLRSMVDDKVGALGSGTEWLHRLINQAGGKDRLAARLAGTSDKSSRAYKSQRDYISRVLRGGRGIGRDKAGKLSAEARQMAADKVRRKVTPPKVKIAATWKMSKTEWHGAATAEFTGEERETLAGLIESGDSDAILDMVASKYGEDFAANVFDVTDFEGIEIE
jgi:hypothetical protein